MSILNENDVYQNAEQSIIDRLAEQIEQNIQNELINKADKPLVDYLYSKITFLLEESGNLHAQLHLMQTKMREMEDQLNNCLRLDNLIHGNDYYRNEVRDVWGTRVDTVDSPQYDDAGV